MHFTSKWPFAFLALVLACGGDSNPNIPGPSNGDGGTATDSSPSTSDSGAPALDAGADADAATVADNRIDPIALGKSWTYNVAIIGTYPICKAGSYTGAVLSQKAVAGKAAFQVQSFCPGAGTNSYYVDGDRVEVYYGGAWVLSLDTPVAEGHTWTDGLFTYVWAHVGTDTVPAGTFTDCWDAKHQGGVNYTRFCRGVGPVRWHYVDGSGNGYDATLTTYK